MSGRGHPAPAAPPRTSRSPRLLGAVLAGGRSRRFGSDKARARIEGVTLVDRAAATLGQVVEDVVVVSSHGVDTARPVVADLRGPCGPLGGIEAALAHAAERGLDGVFVLACDLPLVGADTVRRVVAALEEDPETCAAAPAGDEGRVCEPLCAAYRVECLEVVASLLDDGRLEAAALFERVGGTVVARPEGEMVNVNTPEDGARAEGALRARAAPGDGGGSSLAELARRGPPPSAVTGRLASLDAFRGLTIAGMILVNNPGSWSFVYAPLAHAPWHGWTPTDLIFPYFLFILGVALPFSFARRLAEGARRSDLVRHVARRSLILIGLGLAMRAIPDFDLAEMRWPGVLQRIGVVYFATGCAFILLSRRARWVLAPLLLLAYWGAMTWVPVPGFGAGDLTPAGNLAAWIDRALMGGHLWQESWDPEGLLSTVPAIGTALLGVFTGEWLRSGRSRPALARGLALAGLALVPIGLAWGLVFPINKNLWTSSYVVFTAGTALLLFSLMFWLIDARGARGAWERWMVVLGMNAIAVFVASGMVTKAMTRIEVGDTSLYAWVYETLFRSWAGPYDGSLAFALVYVACWLGVAWAMDRRRIHVKI